MNEKIGRIYFGILGIITLIFGIADLVVTLGGSSFSWGILEMPSDISAAVFFSDIIFR
jgi:hypothetical protein